MTHIQEAPDFARLSAAERKVLELLAQGHTAKSIAGLMGQTEGAIHERLRSARRKTGVGSSRELARLLGSQEIRTEKIVMSDAPAPFEGLQAAPRQPGLAPSKGPLIMLLMFSATAAALLLQTASSTAPDGPPPVDDPLVGRGMFAKDLDYRTLHDQVRREPRDEAWASQAEATLKTAYQQGAKGGEMTELRVICGSTLCEAAGRMQGSPNWITTVDDAGPGLHNLGGGWHDLVGPHVDLGGRPKPAAFLFYWKRGGG